MTPRARRTCGRWATDGAKEDTICAYIPKDAGKRMMLGLSRTSWPAKSVKQAQDRSNGSGVWPSGHAASCRTSRGQWCTGGMGDESVQGKSNRRESDDRPESVEMGGQHRALPRGWVRAQRSMACLSAQPGTLGRLLETFCGGFAETHRIRRLATRLTCCGFQVFH